MCKVYTGYDCTSEMEHCLCACTVDYPLAKARDYLSVLAHKPYSISHFKGADIYKDSANSKDCYGS